MVNVTCYHCQLVFGMPDAVYAARKRDGAAFYCPNGHGQVFTEATIPKLEREIERLKTRVSEEGARADRNWAVAEGLRRSNAALRAVITRMKNKAKGAP